MLVGSAREIYRRLMDSVDPTLVRQTREIASGVEGVRDITSVRIRWVGHDLRATVRLTVDPHLSVVAAHDISEAVNNDLLHRIPRLKEAVIHCDPEARGEHDPHERTAHHGDW